MKLGNPSRRAAASTTSASQAHPVATGPVSPEGTQSARPGAGMLGLARNDTPADPPEQSFASSSQGTLIVGEGIQVKGEIQSCTTLIVEGRVEASLEAEELTVREGGVYDGKAVVESARISGDFSGDLTVHGLLTVSAGGRVNGSLRYGDLRIEQGGRLSGDVDLLEDAGPAQRQDIQEAAKAAVEKAQAAGEVRTGPEPNQQQKELLARS